MEIYLKSVIKSLHFARIPSNQRYFYTWLLVGYVLIAIFSIVTSSLDSAFRGNDVDFLWVIQLKNERSITSSRGYRENMLRLIASFESNSPN